MVSEINVRVAENRVLHAYTHGAGGTAVMWFHGTPNIGTPPAPLFADADRLGVRFAGYDRPGYGGSTARPDRSVASAAADVAAVADALGLERFAVFGHSGGGPHALAAAALLGDRVTAAVSISGLAPFSADGLDWFAGIGPAGQASLRAAVAGRAAKEAHAAAPNDAMPDFSEADWAALEGDWGWFGSVVEPALKAGPAPLIDDDLAYVRDWGFDPATITAPVLLVHGGDDRMVPAAHSEWLGRRIPGAETLIVPGEGHISVLPPTAVRSLEWIVGRGARPDGADPSTFSGGGI
jgi:pimeloyl-ACP methyl ester carboxylesterase